MGEVDGAFLTDTNARLTMRLYDDKPARRDMEDANG